MCAYVKQINIELVVIFYVYAHAHKEIKKNEFLGEKRDPSERHANSNLRNVTHITQKPSYVYTFFASTLKKNLGAAELLTSRIDGGLTVRASEAVDVIYGSLATLNTRKCGAAP